MSGETLNTRLRPVSLRMQNGALWRLSAPSNDKGMMLQNASSRPEDEQGRKGRKIKGPSPCHLL
jgi:hypothetical protein